MNATRDLSRWVKGLGIAGLSGLVLLVACGKLNDAEAPVATTQQSNKTCHVPHAYTVGQLNKYDEDLFTASAAGDVRQVEQSIVQGANVNVTGSLKRTPLFAAAFCDRPPVAAILIDNGSHVNAKDANGMSPLHAAVIIGGVETAKVLIAKGADINILDRAGRTPLHLAAATDQIALVELLLNHGANALARDRSGFTAATLASENGHAKPGTFIRQWQETHKVPHKK